MKKVLMILTAILMMTVFLVSCTNTGQAMKATSLDKQDEVARTSCVDSDATSSNPYIVFGSVRGGIYAGTLPPADRCQNSDSLVEYYCSGNRVESRIVSCSNLFGANYICQGGRCVMSGNQTTTTVSPTTTTTTLPQNQSNNTRSDTFSPSSYNGNNLELLENLNSLYPTLGNSQMQHYLSTNMFNYVGGARVYTQALVMPPAKVMYTSQSDHIPDDPAYYEKFYFTPGDLGYKVFKTKFATLGVLICWDQWYPEAARITSLMGAEILFYPTAIGWATSQDETTNNEQYNAWQTIQRSHAVANGVHVVSVNRVGLEQNGAMKFWGGSFVSNPFGSLIYKASHDDEETTVIELDLAKTDQYRTHWPFLRDRRIDSYQPITKRFIDED